jgi:hypothetical protein
LWQKLAVEWKPENLLDLYTEISIDEIMSHIDLILEGKLKGRTIVKMIE